MTGSELLLKDQPPHCVWMGKVFHLFWGYYDLKLSMQCKLAQGSFIENLCVFVKIQKMAKV